MDKLFVPRELIAEILAHCKECYPYEACGILAGQFGVSKKIYKIKNIEKSSVSYMMEPGEQFTVMKEMREQGLEMTAIYHSHPVSSAYPSPKDVSLAFYQDSVYVIVSLVNDEPLIKAFEIKDDIIKEIEIIYS
ncbi:MAG: M67 family metallopeptidase [Nitrospirae bacterium]|jgi:[CysO sulfur-carrier protein]-S-L-cysteine hydrolase|nr:M67 family metallopeptidase [Nitrospirota bacterium]